MSEFLFLYWDDLGDSQEEVDNQNRESLTESLSSNRQIQVDDSEKEEQEAIRRMQIIMRNGNSGEHYDIYDDGELEDVE